MPVLFYIVRIKKISKNLHKTKKVFEFDKNKKEGRLVIEDNFLKATKEGLYVLNDILVDFMK